MRIPMAALLLAAVSASGCSERDFRRLDDEPEADEPAEPDRERTPWDLMTPDDLPDLVFAVVWTDVTDTAPCTDFQGAGSIRSDCPGTLQRHGGLGTSNPYIHDSLLARLPPPRMSFVDRSGAIRAEVELPYDFEAGWSDVHALHAMDEGRVVVTSRATGFGEFYGEGYEGYEKLAVPEFASWTVDGYSGEVEELVRFRNPMGADRTSDEPWTFTRPDGTTYLGRSPCRRETHLTPRWFPAHPDRLWAFMCSQGEFDAPETPLVIGIPLGDDTEPVMLTQEAFRQPTPSDLPSSESTPMYPGWVALGTLTDEPEPLLVASRHSPHYAAKDYETVAWPLHDDGTLGEMRVRETPYDTTRPVLEDGTTFGWMDTSSLQTWTGGVPERHYQYEFRDGRYGVGAGYVAVLDFDGPTWIHLEHPEAKVLLDTRAVIQHRERRLAVIDHFKDGLGKRTPWIHKMVLVRE